MLCQLTFYFTSTTVVLNHFVEGSQIQTYNLVREPHSKFNTSQLRRFFIALSLLHKILEC